MIAPVIATLAIEGANILTGFRTRTTGFVSSHRPRIYFANHTSHLDFVLVSAALPPSARHTLRPVAARDYWDHGLFRRYLIHQVFHGVMVDRSPTLNGCNPLQPLLESLDCGESLLLFPEGTRGSGNALQPFKPGLFYLAQARPLVEVVPVWIDNVSRALPKGAVLPHPAACSVHFGRSQKLLPGEDRSSFLVRMRESLLTLSQL